MKKLLALSIASAMLIANAPAADLQAAKKPALKKKTVSVKVGASVKISVKNAKKSAKVTWKTSSKAVAKITKSTKKGNASATVKGVKKGTATIKVTVKQGTTKNILKCKVIVKAADVKTAEAPVVTKTPSVPAAVTEAPQVTTAPGVTADPNATVAPTHVPIPTDDGQPKKWVTTWGTAEEKNDITAEAMPQLPLKDSTIRQIIKVTTSGQKIKFRLSNQYGTTPVKIKSMHIAKQVDPAKSRVDLTTDMPVTVGGKEEFSIPAGKVIETDGVWFDVKALENIAVSTYFESGPTKNITGHRGARATSYQMAGNQVERAVYGQVAGNKNSYKTTTSWFFLADCSLMVPTDSKAVVCFGDSITDGYGTDASYLGKKPDSYTRWGDYFAKRLQANDKTKNVSVINEGIGSNGMLGSYPTDAGKDRFKRDLIEHDGVAYCIILFGVNDLNQVPLEQADSKFAALKAEYEKMIKLCHDNKVKVYAAPILPFGGSGYYSEGSEKVRKSVNDWFRSTASGVDGIIDFESAVLDPASVAANPNKPKVYEKYTHSDGLHPYDGYEAMANAIDLKMFE